MQSLVRNGSEIILLTCRILKLANVKHDVEVGVRVPYYNLFLLD